MGMIILVFFPEEDAAKGIARSHSLAFHDNVAVGPFVVYGGGSDSNRRMHDAQGGRNGDEDDDGVITATHAHIIHASRRSCSTEGDTREHTMGYSPSRLLWLCLDSTFSHEANVTITDDFTE